MTDTPDPSTVTMLLDAARTGDRTAVDRLFPLVYEELRNRARRQRGYAAGNATMNTTAIVHEAYIKLADQPRPDWENRAHFFAVAAKAMRHVFLDYAKRKQATKRGGDQVRIGFNEAILADGPSDDETAWQLDDSQADRLLALETALQELSGHNSRAAAVVECRFFGGMTIPDTAAALGISPATAKRDWVFAQAWLFRAIDGQHPAS